MHPDATVTVPDLVGMEVDAAWMHGHDIGVVVSSTDPDGPPVHDRDASRWPRAPIRTCCGQPATPRPGRPPWIGRSARQAALNPAVPLRW